MDIAHESQLSEIIQNIKQKPENSKDTSIFPKKIGIVFIDDISDSKKILKNTLKELLLKIKPKKENNKPHLNFNQIACAHLLLQMNKVQNIFDFQIIRLRFPHQLSYSPNEYNLKWFANQISKIENSEEGKMYNIDYWISITSDNIEHNWHYIGEEQANPRKAIITSLNWEGVNSPPSLFEYLSISVLMCSLYFINREFYGRLGSHPKLITKGCVYDFTIFKPDRRILVSNPYLCSLCREQMYNLEKIIRNKTSSKIELCESINKIIAREWMGDIEKKDSPLYNIKKNYGYDINRNSGFNKKWWETIRDSIIENTAQWILGTLVSGIITGILILLKVPQ
jgi:hypothetical protein